MWFVIALFTALAWGFCYICVEQVIKSVDKFVYLSISATCNAIFWIFCLFYYKNDKMALDFDAAKWWVVASVSSVIAGNYLSMRAVELKNATYASVVEISYPIWCALFAWLLLGHNHLTWKSGFGIVLVISGIICFVLGSKA